YTLSLHTQLPTPATRSRSPATRASRPDRTCTSRSVPAAAPRSTRSPGCAATASTRPDAPAHTARGTGRGPRRTARGPGRPRYSFSTGAYRSSSRFGLVSPKSMVASAFAPVPLTPTTVPSPNWSCVTRSPTASDTTGFSAVRRVANPEAPDADERDRDDDSEAAIPDAGPEDTGALAPVRFQSRYVAGISSRKRIGRASCTERGKIS